MNNPQVNVKLHFVQWTLEIKSEQTFAVKQGAKVLSGDTEKPIQVTYWPLNVGNRGTWCERDEVLFRGT